MKKWNVAAIVIAISLFILFLILISRLLAIEKEDVAIETVTDISYGQGYISDGGEVGSIVPAEEGDAGIVDEEVLTIYSEIPMEASGKTKEGMVAFILDYMGYIPFADGGRFYGTGYFKSPDGVDNRIQSPAGMDSLGYVIWVYRNVFGSCSEKLENPVANLQEWQQVSVENLQIGDIGMYTDKAGERNHFGIFVGYDHGIPVFSHCSGLMALKYPCGNDRLSFLKSMTSLYYMGNAPVEFNFFFRLDVPWEIKEVAE